MGSVVDRQAVFRLWDELARFPAADIDAAWRHLAQSVSQWIDADTAFWVGTVRLMHGEQAERDLMHGWRIKVVSFLHPPSEAERLSAQRAERNRQRDPGMTTIAAVRGSGVFRVHRLHDGFVDIDALRQTDYYRDTYELFDLRDQVWVASPINAEAESYFVFNRVGRPDRFTETDAELAGFVMRPLNWFIRQMFHSHGLLVAQEPLTATQREVLQMLLSDKSEKQIAADLGQSYHTTHTHVKEIFRKYNVTSRAGLMAVWLS